MHEGSYMQLLNPDLNRFNSPMLHVRQHLRNDVLLQSCMPLLAEQLEAALALAHQRIADLEAQVESLEATVQSLKEALAAAIGHAGHLQVSAPPPELPCA